MTEQTEQPQQPQDTWTVALVNIKESRVDVRFMERRKHDHIYYEGPSKRLAYKAARQMCAKYTCVAVYKNFRRRGEPIFHPHRVWIFQRQCDWVPWTKTQINMVRNSQ